MINLLPPEEKKEILLKRKRAVVLVNLILLLLFFVLLASTMSLMKFYWQTRTTYLNAQFINNKQILERNLDEKTLNKINSLNLSFEKLNDFYSKKTYISEVLEKITHILPDKIYLTYLSISPDVVAENENDALNKLIGFKISITGFSPTREEIIQLKENMEKEEDFKEVFFPLTNWVKSTNVNFSLSFKIVKP